MDRNDIFKMLSLGTKKSCKFQTGLVHLPQQQQAKQDEKKVVSSKENVRKLTSSDTRKNVQADDSSPPLQYLSSWPSSTCKGESVSKDKKRSSTKEDEICALRKKHRIKVYGSDIPAPLHDFQTATQLRGISNEILANLERLGFAMPTPIQMQAVPAMMDRRELLACAPTGSGKTLAYILPVLHHLKKPKKKGFRAIVLAPTRELAKQIHREFCRIGEGLGFRIHVLNNITLAMQKYRSSKKYDILVTTPRKLVVILEQDPPILHLSTVHWLVIDESDKLFDVGRRGFREQLATIYKACSIGNPNIRRALFSATYTSEVEEWCRYNLDNLITITVGARNTTVDVVSQELQYTGSEYGKLYTLRETLKQGFTPPVLIFTQSKDRAQDLFSELKYDGMNVDVIHSDRPQIERDEAVERFRSGLTWVLISTELMGRGIDFKGVNLVVNYDFPPSAISYIHRIGRTGRAGRPGRAITFFTGDDVVNLRSIANVMRHSGCAVPEYMLSMKKPSKKQRRSLEHKPVNREKISTTPAASTTDPGGTEESDTSSKKMKKQKKKDVSAKTASTSHSTLTNPSHLSLKKKAKYKMYKERIKQRRLQRRQIKVDK